MAYRENITFQASGNTTQQSSAVIGGNSNIVFEAAGGASIGLSNNRVLISVNAGGGLTNINVSAGTTSNNLSALTFNNANGISFGLNASVITASHNGLTSQSNQAVSAANGSFTFQTITFANSNGVSFSTGTQGLFASHNGLTSQSNQAFDAGAVSSAFQTLVFQDSNGVSFSNNAGSVRVTHGLQFTSNTSAITSNALHTSSPRINVSAGTTSNNLSALTFNNANGITFGLNASVLTASHNGLTTARASNDAIGLNTAQTNVTWTVNSSGISINASGYAGTGTTYAGTNINASVTLNSNGLNLALSAAGGGTTNQTGPNIAAGTQTATSGTVVFSNSNNISFGMSNSSVVTASYSPPQVDMAYWDNMSQKAGSSGTIQMGSANTVQAQVYVFPLGFMQGSMSIQTLMMNMSHSATGNSSSAPKVFTVRFGLYTLNGSTLSILNSASAVFSINANAANSTAYSGQRWIQFASTNWSSTPVVSQDVEYFGAFFYSSGGNNSAAQTAAFLGAHAYSTGVRSGVFGVDVTTANSLGYHPWVGVHTVSSALPSSVNLADLNKRGASSNFIPHVVFNNLSSYL